MEKERGDQPSWNVTKARRDGDDSGGRREARGLYNERIARMPHRRIVKTLYRLKQVLSLGFRCLIKPHHEDDLLPAQTLLVSCCSVQTSSVVTAKCSITDEIEKLLGVRGTCAAHRRVLYPLATNGILKPSP